ncbi:MAG: secondary thiamine-phosphate synthase enzyme [Rhodobiaceae bacterium]|nr:secondary thiamine-phosphate synthase enzyme [Rhodobiaceae bacterium]|tara:strand:+ start:677 stop:1108 length:432 start_codon:yes stop_codon:yes gene_type:complete
MTSGLWQARGKISLTSGGFSVHEVTHKVAGWLNDEGAREGLLTVFIRHTSASLLIMENADPDVLADLMDALKRLAPEDDDLYRHRTEGADDMPAHIRTALTQTHLSIPVTEGRMDLGTWQGIWLLEHCAQAQSRELVLHYVGE